MRCRHWRRRVEGSFNTFRSRSTSRNKRRESRRSLKGLRALAVLLVISGLGVPVERAHVFRTSVTFVLNNGLNATNHVSERWLNSPPWNNTNTQDALHGGSRTAALNYNCSQTLLPPVACRWTRHSHYSSEVGS
jgi:cytoskeletal protein RodZ